MLRSLSGARLNETRDVRLQSARGRRLKRQFLLKLLLLSLPPSSPQTSCEEREHMSLGLGPESSSAQVELNPSKPRTADHV